MDYTQKELEQFVKPSFRAKQIYGWLYHHYVDIFEDMKNIPITKLLQILKNITFVNS